MERKLWSLISVMYLRSIKREHVGQMYIVVLFTWAMSMTLYKTSKVFNAKRNSDNSKQSCKNTWKQTKEEERRPLY